FNILLFKVEQTAFRGSSCPAGDSFDHQKYEFANSNFDKMSFFQFFLKVQKFNTLPNSSLNNCFSDAYDRYVK
ncbi:MAG: hypothetical protein KDD04_05685, partial [Sinomicrobium sp.]|nr:hypothetical protein [Sinomicrobium sp.]